MKDEAFFDAQLGKAENSITNKESDSVCNSLEEQRKLLQLFEIFILVDKQLHERKKS